MLAAMHLPSLPSMENLGATGDAATAASAPAAAPASNLDRLLAGMPLATTGSSAADEDRGSVASGVPPTPTRAGRLTAPATSFGPTDLGLGSLSSTPRHAPIGGGGGAGGLLAQALVKHGRDGGPARPTEGSITEGAAADADDGSVAGRGTGISITSSTPGVGALGGDPRGLVRATYLASVPGAHFPTVILCFVKRNSYAVDTATEQITASILPRSPRRKCAVTPDRVVTHRQAGRRGGLRRQTQAGQRACGKPHSTTADQHA